MVKIDKEKCKELNEIGIFAEWWEDSSSCAVDLSGNNLRGSSFIGSNLRDSIFRDSHLDFSDLTGSSLCGARTGDEKLDEAIKEHCKRKFPKYFEECYGE